MLAQLELSALASTAGQILQTLCSGHLVIIEVEDGV